MDKILLRNMKFFAYHGVLPEEQANGQNFYVDVEMILDLKKAGNSDALEDSVDYSGVYALVRDTVENNKFRLIEKLAHGISREIMSRYEKIVQITIRVRKPEAPIDGQLDYAEVEITRCRKDA